MSPDGFFIKFWSRLKEKKSIFFSLRYSYKTGSDLYNTPNKLNTKQYDDVDDIFISTYLYFYFKVNKYSK